VAPSYETFVAFSLGENVDWSRTSFRGSAPDATAILAAAQRLLGSSVDLVTIDMPIATVPIAGRRAADDAISTQFGGRWCSAHTPSASRPGILGARLTAEFTAAGYYLASSTTAEPLTPCLIEVYPHPALLSLMKRAQRVPYKVSKSRRYWPDFTVRQRIEALLKEFHDIRTALTYLLGPVAVPLPPAADVESLSSLKRYEDALDALVCAWVGVQFLLERSVPLGDGTAAIWCPRDVVFS
jgi:predicted RNase H-like nuclease